MPRAPKIRVSYRQDASYLLRLSEAVALDHKLEPEYRSTLVAQLEQSARKLMDARHHLLATVADDEAKDQ